MSSSIQSKADNPESFNWFLKTLQEEEKKQGISGEQPGAELDETTKINLLRFIKVVRPTVGKLMDFSKGELNLSMLTTTLLLDEMEKGGDIAIEELPQPAQDSGGVHITDKIVRITDQGLAKL